MPLLFYLFILTWGGGGHGFESCCVPCVNLSVFPFSVPEHPRASLAVLFDFLYTYIFVIVILYLLWLLD